MKKKAIAAGHICLDITPVFPESKKTDIGRLIQPGKLFQVGEAEINTGGAVANTGLGMKALGADVKLMGKIGRDAFGAIARGILKEYGADEGLIEVPGETTSYSVVLAPPGTDRSFLHCPGANSTFTSSDIPDEALEDVSLFHFGYPTLMPKFYENDGEELEKLYERVKRHGIAASLDLSAVDPDSEAGRADWPRILKRVLPYVDFFVPSFEELASMLMKDRYEELLLSAGGEDLTGFLQIDEDVEPLGRMCLDMGAKSVLIKCGASGLFFLSGSHMGGADSRLPLDGHKWSNLKIFIRSYRIDRVLSGTGAGDVCIAAFLTSILEGYGPKESLEHAAAAGALCCTSYDAVSAIPSLSLLRARIDAGWEQNPS